MDGKPKRQLPYTPQRVHKPASFFEQNDHDNDHAKNSVRMTRKVSSFKEVRTERLSSNMEELEKDFHERLQFVTSSCRKQPIFFKIWSGRKEKKAPPLYQWNKYEPKEVLDVTLDYMEKELNGLKSQVKTVEEDFAAIREDTLSVRKCVGEIRTLKSRVSTDVFH